jgi:hypothetical protein
MASRYGHPTIVRILLEYGANINAVDKVAAHSLESTRLTDGRYPVSRVAHRQGVSIRPQTRGVLSARRLSRGQWI